MEPVPLEFITAFFIMSQRSIVSENHAIGVFV